MRTRKILLPARRNLEAFDSTDPMPYCYQPILGWFFRRRLEIGLELLEADSYPKLLEIGFGSGVLFKTLASLAREIHAVDIHPKIAQVEGMLRREGLAATLSAGDILHLDFPIGSFDAVVCFSVLEHIADTDRAIAEVSRVLKPNGVAILGFPAVNRTMRFLFHSIGVHDIDERHVSGGKKILASCRRFMQVERVRRLPWFLPPGAAVYVACRCRKMQLQE
jgi:2-polyprenyl-3-methyl-5-hydroxy-6-metoxy-1,4-benzoquinol methylase